MGEWLEPFGNDGELNGHNIYDEDFGDFIDQEPSEQLAGPLVNQKPKQTTMSEVSTKPPVPFKKIKSEDYDDGQVVQTIAGTIISLFDVKKGESSGGNPYEFQNGKMKDSEGTEIDICFSSNSQPKTAKGKKVTIRSVKTEQHGWNGIKVEDQSFTPQGKSEPVQKRVLKITGSADITYDGGESSAKSGASASQSGGGQSGFQATAGMHPEVFLADVVAFHRRCYECAESAYPDLPNEDKTKIMDNSALRQSATAAIFIEGVRHQMHINYIENSKKPVPVKIPPPPKNPAQWRECIIPKGEMMGKTLADLNDDQLMAFYDAMKDKEHPFAKCVQFAADERGLLKKQKEADAALEPDPAEDDIPF